MAHFANVSLAPIPAHQEPKIDRSCCFVVFPNCNDTPALFIFNYSQQILGFPPDSGGIDPPTVGEGYMYSAVLMFALASPAQVPVDSVAPNGGGLNPTTFPERAALAFFRLVIVWPLRLGTFPARALFYPLTGTLRYFPGSGGGFGGGFRGGNDYFGYGDGGMYNYGGTTIPSSTEPKLAPAGPKTSIEIKTPEGARLYVDGAPAPKPAAEVDGVQTFQAPELTKGSFHTYTFSIEIVKDGRVEQKSQTVHFKAGDSVKVDFTEPVAVTRK
jgi:uncharacterized protein (TIGR03000 family)